MINNVPNISPKKITPRRGIFSRLRGKRRPTRKRSSVGGGHKINLLEKKSMHKRRNSPIYKGLGSDLIITITKSSIYTDLLMLIIFDDLYMLYINEKNENEINVPIATPKIPK